MSIKIGLLGFGTVASGIPFLLKENGEKVLSLPETTTILSQMLTKSLTMKRFKSL